MLHVLPELQNPCPNLRASPENRVVGSGGGLMHFYCFCLPKIFCLLFQYHFRHRGSCMLLKFLTQHILTSKQAPPPPPQKKGCPNYTRILPEFIPLQIGGGYVSYAYGSEGMSPRERLTASCTNDVLQGFSQVFRIGCPKIHIWGELDVQFFFIPLNIHKKHGY